MTDNHFSYKLSTDVAKAMADLNAKHVFIRPHCPWQNGKVERYNRTLQVERA
jgi:transposase InsO family protein